MRHAGMRSLGLLSVLAAACASHPQRTVASDGGVQGIDAAIPDAETAPGKMTCAEAEATRSYIGCDYWPTVVTNYVWSVFDFAVVVANVGDEPADILITGPGNTNRTAQVPPNQLLKLYLPWVQPLKVGEFSVCGGWDVRLVLPGPVMRMSAGSSPTLATTTAKSKTDQT